MKRILLRTNESLLIRETIPADAARIIAYVKMVGDESDFLTFSGAEFNKTIAEEISIIEDHQKAPNQLFIMGEIEGEIAGLLNVHSSPKPRLQHIGEFGISVRKDHWNKGIASLLLHYMIDWAKASSIIRKLNLRVMTHNISAIHLYQKMGFEQEGCVRRDLYLNGQFRDSYQMGMLID